jgi:hypothetical protein
MIAKLKHSVWKALLRPLRASLEQWLETRALQLPRDAREELARRFGATPETIDAVNQTLKTYAIRKFREFWESYVR